MSGVNPLRMLPRVRALWLLAVLLTACAAPPGPGASALGGGLQGDVRTTPKRLIASVMDDPPVLNRMLSPTAVRGLDALEELLHVGLATVAASGSLSPRLADAVPSVENGLWILLPDGRMETTWRIRPGARWHDGAAFGPHDLLFTITLVQDRELVEFRDPAYDLIESARSPDANALTVTWVKPFIDADTLFSRAGSRGAGALPMPRHILEKPYLDDKARLAQLPHWTHEFVGTGPFRVKELVPGAHIVLAANDSYVLGRPRLDEIEVRFITDPNTVLANVMAGTIHVNLGRGLNLEQAIMMRDQWRDGKIAVNQASWIMIWPQLLNPNPAVLSDLRFRRAATHAIDRQQLVDTLSFGLTSVAHSYLSPSDPNYREIEASVVRHEYDPRRAGQLVEELGYTRGADGSFRDGSNQRLAVEIRTSGGDTLRERLMLAAADYWQRVGIGADTVVISRQQAQDQQFFLTYPAFLLSRNPNTLDNLSGFHSRAAGLPENNFRGSGGINYPRYLNPEFDALIDRYFTTIPRSERIAIVRQVMHQMSAEVIVIGLFYSTDQNLIANRLVGVGGREARSTEAWNAHEWDIR